MRWGCGNHFVYHIWKATCMPSKEIDKQLLYLYIEGNCSTDQLNQIKEYLTDEAYRDSLHCFMQEEWERLSNAELPALPGMPELYARFRFYLAHRDTHPQKISSLLPYWIIKRWKPF
jgi:hypothetical protein